MRHTHLQLSGARVFAERSAKAKKKPVYVFDFCRGNAASGLANHGYETHFLLGTYKDLPGVNEGDDAAAATMQEYWCHFIKTGDPNGPGLPQWDPYSAEHRQVAYLDAETRVLPDEEAEHPLMTFAREFLEEKLEREYPVLQIKIKK